MQHVCLSDVATSRFNFQKGGADRIIVHAQCSAVDPYMVVVYIMIGHRNQANELGCTYS